MRDQRGRRCLAPQSLLECVKTCRLTALYGPLHEQFAVKHTNPRKSTRNVWKATCDILAAPTVKPDIIARTDNLDANTVPFPFNGKIGEINARVFKRVREHECTEIGSAFWIGPPGCAAPPSKKLDIRRGQCVPHLFHIVDTQRKGIGKRRLRQPRRDADAQSACRKFEQRIAAVGIEPVHEFGEQRWRTRAARLGQAGNDGIK